MTKLMHWIFSTCFFLILLNCGLPSSAGIFIERPGLSVQVTADKEITLRVTGNYSPDDYSDFAGINLYIGDNNKEDEIEKRIIYFSSEEFLPSVSAKANEDFSTNITLKNEFSYRYTSKAEDQDYTDANIATEKEKLLTKRLYALETYYFRVKAVNNDGTSSASSNIVPIKIPLIIPITIDLTTNPTLGSFDKIKNAWSGALEREFQERKLNDRNEDLRKVDFEFGSIQFRLENGYPILDFINGLSTGEQLRQIDTDPTGNSSPNSIFDEIVNIDKEANFIHHPSYQNFPTYPIEEKWYYSFIQTTGEKGKKRDLRMFIDKYSELDKTLDITLAYYDEEYKIDIETKENIDN